jgi:TonB-linked SusC/RagA family outer membrane protein
MTHLFYFAGLHKKVPAFLSFFLMLLGSVTAFGQVSVSGKVLDSNTQEALVGATVKVTAGATTGTVADTGGNFTVTVPSLPASIEVSLVGYKKQELDIYDKPDVPIVINLVEDLNLLNEVVVIGYGTQKKVSITGAVGSIQNEKINRLANSSVAALQGLIPGLTVLDKGGAPGRANTTLRIRGITTINNSNALILVDGIEQRIDDINPDDIETISILKDASATAIYGSRAANGVVLVTTKRGGYGKAKINFNAYYGVQNVVDKPEPMESTTYMRLKNAALVNNGGKERYSESVIQEWRDNHDKDPEKYPLFSQWQDVVYHSAPQQNYHLSISGGNEKFKGLVSLRYYKQDGIVDHFKSDTKEIRINNDFKPFKHVRFSADANYRVRYSLEPPGAYDSDNGGGGIFYSMFHATNFVVPVYSDGSYGLGNKNSNPLVYANLRGDKHYYDNLLVANLKGEADLYDGLKFTVQYALRNRFYKTEEFINKFTVTDTRYFDWQSGTAGTAYTPNPNRKRTQNTWNRNSLRDYREDQNEYTFNALLDYEKAFGKHAVHALGGFSQIVNKWSHNEAYRQDFYNNDVTSINMGDKDASEAYGYNTEYALQSYFGRLNYNYDNRYLLEANLRYDGTSRFTGDNQFGTFPSFSAGWRISQESFWEPLLPYISDLKLRGSWGKTGNQTAGLYAFYDSYSPVYTVINETLATGYTQTVLANKDLRWETSTQTDIGIDAGFLNNRLTVAADYYYKRTDGILVNLPVAGVIGLDAPVQNAAIVDNKGFELLLTWNDKAGDVTYGANFNISNNSNEVISLGGANPTISGGTADVVRTVKEGEPINAYWGFKTGGLLTQADIDAGYPKYDPRMGAGDVKYLDLSGPDGTPDGKIDDKDKTVIGDEFPRFPFAFGGNAAWKGFDFSFLFQGVAAANVRVSGAMIENGNFEGTALDIGKDYWTTENLNARFPKPRQSTDYNAMMSDYWIVDAGYLRLKNIELGYTLPNVWTRRLSIDKARIYGSATNVFTVSDVKEWGLDPEFSAGRFLYDPQTAVYSIGLNLVF